MALYHSSLRALRRPRAGVVTKANSYEILSNRRGSVSSEDNEVGGGALGESSQRPASSGPQTSGLSTFLVGNPSRDDVFTSHEPSTATSTRTVRSNVPNEAEEVAEEPSSPEEKETGDEEDNRAIVQHQPVQIDAQNIYPPSACVFAANLSQSYDDQRLEIEVTKCFSIYGSVFVKIRRDMRQMPFAFCQFTCDADARKAEKYGKGIMILGRPCRIEMAKAHASFIIYKISGFPTSEQEAIDLLGMLGEISKVVALEESLRLPLRLPPAMVVHYKMYDPKRDVQRNFQKHRVFRVIPYEPKAAEPRPDHRRGNDDHQTMIQYDRDRRSAFFGNLPLSMTEESLASLASSCGKVVSVDLKRKHVPQGDNKSIEICFGFVEFVRPDSIDDAMVVFNNTNIDGHTLKVERKQSRQFETPRRMGQHSSHIPFPRSSVHRRRAGGTFEPGGPSRSMYGGAYASPTASHPGAFASPGEGYAGAFASPTAYNGGAYHPSTRQRRQFSTATAGPAPRVDPDEESGQASNPAAVKSEAPKDAKVIREEAKVEEVKVKEVKVEEDSEVSDAEVKDTKGKGKTVEMKEDVKGKGKAVETKADVKGKGKATETSPTISEAQPAASAPIPPAMGYPMMSPYAAYGYTPMASYMPSPLTPQGAPMMYGTYPGFYYTPAPMYPDTYSMYPWMASYAPIPFSETPTRAAGSSQTEEQKFDDTSYKEKTTSEGKGKERAR